MVDIRDDTGASSTILKRLWAGRFVLGVVIGVLVLGMLIYKVAVGHALIALLFILVAFAITPRRPRTLRMRSTNSVRRHVWPDNHMKSLAGAIPDPCFLVDSRGIVRFSNASAKRSFGTVRPGDPFSFKVRDPDILHALENVLAGSEARKIKFSERIPTERVFDTILAPIRLGSGISSRSNAPDFVFILFQDQTEHLSTERMRVDFIANASHELRTPLASLSGFIETLIGPAKNDEVARAKFLDIMLHQAQRMSRLIDDLLSLSRIEQKAHLVPDQIVDLCDVLKHTVDTLTPLAQDQKVTITTDIPSDPCLVFGDRDELIQIAENLMENALKYGCDGNEIVVKIESFGQSDKMIYAMSFEDFGAGFSKEHIHRLTERFYRVNSEVSRAQKGTGLGLAIVKHIVMRHRGRLEIESVVGEGSRFTVNMTAIT
ncbi:MAG: hypothetical protein JKY49_08875 [Cohaesibacteraceae bacterium]|nr:hypothetical protein [Cohaesibacteraceae bacterium]